MSNVNVVSRIVAMIGIVALAATVAQAGGGQGGNSSVINPWQCYVINGDQPPQHVLNLVDQFGTRENVQVGSARLLCTPVSATKPDGSLFGSVSTSDHLTCYVLSPLTRGSNGRPGLYNPDAVVDLNDELNSDQGVKVSVPAFLCTLSDKTCVSGADCPPPE